MALLNTVAGHLLLLIPLLYLGSAATIKYCERTATTWLISQRVSAAALLVSIALVISHLVQGLATNPWVIINSLTLTILTLISGIGWIIMRFSHHYLGGDSRQHEFQFWMLATLAAISLLVTANHIALFIIAWLAVSLCLHQLLIYYPDRAKAVLAAHKKFVLSRVADVLLLAALALFALSSGSLLISDMVAFWANTSDLPWPIELAVVLLALAAIIKCAQLPFHGWLLQVMEAPTPISALLHAGIINIGGFLLLRFVDVLALASFAQWLLLIVGTLTAIIASITLMTRISVKVMLAWSTCAQMGFMLVEIALGFYTLALLHLVAHSFYKAYSFLNSGDIVDSHIRSARDGSHGPSRVWHWLVSGSLISGMTCLFVGITLFVGIEGELTWGTMVVITVLTLGITIFIAESLRYSLQWLHGLVVLSGLGILGLYLLSQQLFSAISAGLFPQVAVTQAQASVVILAFSLFFLLFVAIRLWPNGSLSRRLYPVIYAGLYLDEWFSRRLLCCWSCKQIPQKLTKTSHIQPQLITTGSNS